MTFANWEHISNPENIFPVIIYANAMIYKCWNYTPRNNLLSVLTRQVQQVIFFSSQDKQAEIKLF